MQFSQNSVLISFCRGGRAFEPPLLNYAAHGWCCLAPLKSRVSNKLKPLNTPRSHLLNWCFFWSLNFFLRQFCLQSSQKFREARFAWQYLAAGTYKVYIQSEENNAKWNLCKIHCGPAPHPEFYSTKLSCCTSWITKAQLIKHSPWAENGIS